MKPITSFDRDVNGLPPPTLQHASSGLPGIDAILHDLRTGDNVVWQTRNIDDYRPFVRPFVDASRARGVPVVYFRFARHRPLLTDADGATIHDIPPDIGFERFVTRILDIARETGLGASYVFDSLSDLAVDWYSDSMLANFFRITCPYLYRLDTIAYFGIDHAYHTKRTIDLITNTAQVVLRVHEHGGTPCVQPLKAETRYSPTMFMLHRKTGEAYVPVTSGAMLSEIRASLPAPNLDIRVQQAGVWTRTFLHAEETLAAVRAGRLTYWEAHDSFHRLLRMIATRDERILRLAASCMDLADILEIMRRMIGTGLIGGKALGMLLARGILRTADPAWTERLEPHDSFFVGSDVFYTYLVQNDCWWLRRDLKKSISPDLAAEARARILSGTFPTHIRDQFMEMLDYFGQSPVIVRSSSLLEDNFGNAFSGKYESVFCPNQLSPQERLDALLDAVRTVYASALSEDALAYRAHRGLLDQDEQMALLVQRVSGDLYADAYFPQIAGVGYSFNPFVWDPAIDPHAGFLRLVLGLGTRAVDRLEDDYTRLVALNAPDKRVQHDADSLQRHSQHGLDLLDLPSNTFMTKPFHRLAPHLDPGTLALCTSFHEEARARAREYGMDEHAARVITFDKLLRETSFPDDMRALLRTLQEAYGCPVDIEFAANVEPERGLRINLLQCRPFQANVDVGTTSLEPPPDLDETQILLRSKGPVIGTSAVRRIDRIVYIDPAGYSALPEQKRYALARAVGKLTTLDDGDRRGILLLGPGRWGTSSPSLGVPVRFNDIRNVSVLCELAVMHEGLIPDVSLGSHFFNDLVELDMLYIAITPHNGRGEVFAERLKACGNRLAVRFPEEAAWEGVLWLIEPEVPLPLHADTLKQDAVLYIPSAPPGKAST